MTTTILSSIPWCGPTTTAPCLIRILILLAAVGGLLGPHAAAQSRQPTGIDDRTSLGWATDDAGSYLTADATSVATTWTVADTASFEVDNILTVQATGEKAHVTAISSGAPGTLTVVRGVGGTTAQAIVHGNTDVTGIINCNVNSTYWNNSLDALNKTELHLAAVAASGLFVLELSGTPASPPRGTLNIIPGAGITITCPDNSGAGSTDCTFSAPGATGTGTNFQSMQVNGVAQTAAPTVKYIDGTGFHFSGSHNSGDNSEEIVGSVTGSGAGTKHTYVAFQAAGCGGTGVGAAVDLPTSGGPSPVNHSGTSLLLCTLDFASGANQFFQVSFPLPGDWTNPSTLALQLNWFSNVGTGSTAWSAKAFCAASGSTVLTSTVTWNAASTATTANNATPVTRAASTFSGIATTGCGPGFEVWLQIQRTDAVLGSVVSLKSIQVDASRTY